MTRSIDIEPPSIQSRLDMALDRMKKLGMAPTKIKLTQTDGEALLVGFSGFAKAGDVFNTYYGLPLILADDGVTAIAWGEPTYWEIVA